MALVDTKIANVDPVIQEGSDREQFVNWFEQWLDRYAYEQPRRGQMLEGYVLRIDEDMVLVDVGLKRDAFVPSKDLSMLDREYLENLSVGDPVMVYVLRPAVGDQELLVSLHAALEQQQWSDAQAHMEHGDVLDLTISGKNRGGFLVQYKDLQGFLPYSQVSELRRTRDRQRAEEVKHAMIGSQVPVKIIEVDQERHRLVFSQHAAQEERRQQRLDSLEKGQVVYGRVVNIVDFGAFVGLDGVDGLVHISELDWKRVKHPSEVVKVGDELEVQVLDVDKERERISLSRKSLLPNPWDQVAREFQKGDSVEGRVTKVLDFGAFVELMDGVEGLVHVSELGYTSGQNPQDAVKVGEVVLVRVLDMDPGEGRISLSMRQVPLERQIAWTMERAGGEENRSEAVQLPQDEPVESSHEETG